MNLGYSVYSEIYAKLKDVLTVGSLWARAEYNDGVELSRLHFTVLDFSHEVENTKILVLDGVLVGQVTTLEALEASRVMDRYSIVSYWYVPDDQIDRVHFGS